jgi:hypothetical protein
MIDYKKYIPEMNLPIIVKTSWGEERKAVFDPYFAGYRLTDCIHPMQNCHLAPHDIIEWRYEDEQYMNECRFIENTLERRKTADKILENVKITWWDKLKYCLNWL